MRLLRRLAAGLTVVAGLVLPLLPGPAAAWEDAGTLQIEGRGYGHGKGMSQHGARGAALQGRSWPQIVLFYYPGVTRTSYTGAVRVLISADRDKDTIVRSRSGLAVYDHGTKTATTLPTNLGATKWRIDTRSDGRIRLGYHNGVWRTWRLLASVSDFRAPGVMELETPAGVRRYRGVLRYVAWQQPNGTRTVNAVAMDDYLKGVVPREMPASWPREALRAQVVAARTFAVHQRQARLRQPWELCDTIMCQVYGGYDAEAAATNEAIRLTPGYYLTYGDKPAYTQFSASSGGHTADGGQPYLPAKPDPYDGYPVWRVSVSSDPLQRAHPEIGRLIRVNVQARDSSGRVALLRLDGTLKDIDIPGTEVRTLLGLKSHKFRFL